MSNKVFLIFLIVVALIVIGLVAWTGRNSALDQVETSSATNNTVSNSAVVNTATESNSNTNINSVSGKLVKTEAFELLSPAETSIVGEITTYRFAENNLLNIMPKAMQSAVLNETPVKERVAITIGEITAERLTISSAKDGSDVTIVQAVVGEMLYDFRGNQSYLSNLSNFIKFN